MSVNLYHAFTLCIDSSSGVSSLNKRVLILAVPLIIGSRSPVGSVGHSDKWFIFDASLKGTDRRQDPSHEPHRRLCVPCLKHALRDASTKVNLPEPQHRCGVALREAEVVCTTE